jgi:hypothetical protein
MFHPAQVIELSVCLSVWLSVWLSIWLSVSVWLSVWISIIYNIYRSLILRKSAYSFANGVVCHKLSRNMYDHIAAPGSPGFPRILSLQITTARILGMLGNFTSRSCLYSEFRTAGVVFHDLIANIFFCLFGQTGE